MSVTVVILTLVLAVILAAALTGAVAQRQSARRPDAGRKRLAQELGAVDDELFLAAVRSDQEGVGRE